MHDYDEGVADDTRDRRDIADEIEVELLIKRRIDGVVRCGKEEGIAIWGSADDRLGAEIGASAGPVFDDERLGRAAPTAIGRSRAQRCQSRRQGQVARSDAPAVSDKLAPKRRATRPRARQRWRPGAENFGGEVSF